VLKVNFSKKGQQKSSQKSKSSNHRSGKPAGQRPPPQRNSTTSAGIPKAWRMIAGTHAIKECIQMRPESIKHAIFDRNYGSQPELREIYDLLKYKNVASEERSSNELEKICYSHQGCVIYSSFVPTFDPHQEEPFDDHSLIVALDGVEDPHNLGAVLRTSWLMAASGLIIPSDRAVGLTATVHKVACGGVEHVPVVVTQNFSEAFKPLKEAGFWVFGLSHKAKKTIYDLKMPEKVVWVLGAEDKGLRSTTEKACDELVSLPQVSADASYNVSVAAAMALAETKRQWTR
jgi:23S rRNA (guanosine2251-2'-O)-methyltransferase